MPPLLPMPARAMSDGMRTSLPPGAKTARLADHGRALNSLAPFLWPAGRGDLKLRVLAALTCLVIAKFANVYVPVLLKHTVDVLGPQAAAAAGGAAAVMAIPVGLILAYGLARLGTVTFQELRDALFVRVAQNAVRMVALSVFQHLHALSLRFHLERQTGGLSRVIERGTRAIQDLLTFVLFSILPTLVEILLVCAILWGMFDIRFAAVTFVTIVGYIAYTLTVTEWRLKFRREMNEQDNRANTRAIDSLLNYETVKYFGNEEHEARRYDVGLKGYETAAVRSYTSLSLLNIGQGGIVAVGLILVMLMAAQGVRDGTMTVGDFVLVNAYLIQLYLPLNFLGTVYRTIRQSLTDMDQMFQLLAVDREVQDAPDAQPLVVSQGSIRFRDVRFGYDGRRPILKGVSFDVPPGQTVAIVGPSGAGKSTISRLLFRFYDVNDGMIEIDGQDIRQVAQGSLRAAIGIVPQDTVLFNDTVRYNIAYGRPGASDAEVEEAARLARIHDFVQSLPDGYESMVGERGLKLSGGEKQRVAIARTILKAPRILMFDEATSALDTGTEREIQQSLREVSRGRSTLVIAHRLSTVADADEIVVLVAGEVVERGRHPDLLAQGGVYAEMWKRQAEGIPGDPEGLGLPREEPVPLQP